MSNPCHDDAATRAAREEMVEVVRLHGVRDPVVLAAMARVRRHGFFPVGGTPPAVAYGDHPVPIGWGQTISQPFIVAYMTERLALTPGSRVLEIGTGSGYQAAVLAACGAAVFTVERVRELAEHAVRALSAEGFAGVQARCADGYAGWREEAPFDAIIATCAPPAVPAALTAQLAEGGRMILPVGEGSQRLVFIRRLGGRLIETDDIAVRFVPMVGN